jgi:hypothetical protein
MSHSLDGMI